MNCVNYEQKDFVGVITITREPALNALNAEVLADLDAAFGAIPLGKTRCVILTGAGPKAFVAGADVNGMRCMTQAQSKAFSELGNNLFLRIERFPIPVIAAVNGFALGGGCELAMSCDIRIASENAVFAQPETGLGIPPGFGGTQRLARIVGVGKAKEMIYTCRSIKAREALDIGLVNAVYPQDTLMDECMKMAQRIAGNAPIAVRQSKAAVNRGLQLEIGVAVALESELFSVCFETKDQRNAMDAFCEKRKPDPFVNG